MTGGRSIAHTQVRRPGRRGAVRRAGRHRQPRAAVGPARPAAGRPHPAPAGSPPRLQQYPMASLLASGALLSLGSDWPVSSFRPLEGLAVAVTRQTRDGVPAGGWVPDERLPVGGGAVGVHPGRGVPGVRGDGVGDVSVGAPGRPDVAGPDPTTTDPAGWPRTRGARHLARPAAGRGPGAGARQSTGAGYVALDFVVTIRYSRRNRLSEPDALSGSAHSRAAGRSGIGAGRRRRVGRSVHQFIAGHPP